MAAFDTALACPVLPLPLQENWPHGCSILLSAGDKGHICCYGERAKVLTDKFQEWHVSLGPLFWGHFQVRGIEKIDSHTVPPGKLLHCNQIVITL